MVVGGGFAHGPSCEEKGNSLDHVRSCGEAWRVQSLDGSTVLGSALGLGRYGPVYKFPFRHTK